MPGSGSDLITGCAHDAVLALADTVVGAVKSGAIKRFIVMAGCDGRQKEREYYTEFAKALPKDTVILTAGCAKFRYNSLGLGTWRRPGCSCWAVQLLLARRDRGRSQSVRRRHRELPSPITSRGTRESGARPSCPFISASGHHARPETAAFVSPAVLACGEKLRPKPNTTVEG